MVFDTFFHNFLIKNVHTYYRPTTVPPHRFLCALCVHFGAFFFPKNQFFESNKMKKTFFWKKSIKNQFFESQKMKFWFLKFKKIFFSIFGTRIIVFLLIFFIFFVLNGTKKKIFIQKKNIFYKKKTKNHFFTKKMGLYTKNLFYKKETIFYITKSIFTEKINVDLPIL